MDFNDNRTNSNKNIIIESGKVEGNQSGKLLENVIRGISVFFIGIGCVWIVGLGFAGVAGLYKYLRLGTTIFVAVLLVCAIWHIIVGKLGFDSIEDKGKTVSWRYLVGNCVAFFITLTLLLLNFLRDLHNAQKNPYDVQRHFLNDALLAYTESNVIYCIELHLFSTVLCVLFYCFCITMSYKFYKTCSLKLLQHIEI